MLGKYGLNNFSSFFIDSTDIYNIEVFSSTWLGGRNGIGGTNSNGRDFVNSSKSENNKSIKSSVPYLLMPGDELSFNWQTPIPEVIKGGPFNTAVTRSVSSISFANSPSKVILYGTYLSENKGTGETLNQLLSSDAIHEAL